ncbi:MAG: M20/M25/M40 family metallo-hydrolase, partial [Sphingomicrobium sp.]
EENGYFIGRGASDNKFDVAQLTAAFIELKREGFRPNRDVILLFTGDEEVGGFTNTVAMLKKVRRLSPEFALNSDSGGGILDAAGKAEAYVVQVAEKTYATYEVTVRNPGGHSSAPRKDNAIIELATVLKNVADYSFPAMANDITRDFFRRVGADELGELGAAMRKFADDPNDAAAAAILSAAPEHAGRIQTTCVATRIRGGHADNALPQSATATINCRIFPGIPIATVQSQLARAGKNPSAEWRVSDQSPESGFSPRNPTIDEAIAKAVHSRFPGIPLNYNMSAGGTDGVHFRGAGIPTYGVSSNFTKFNDSFQHGLNERARVESFFGGLDHWPTLIRQLATSP